MKRQETFTVHEGKTYRLLYLPQADGAPAVEWQCLAGFHAAITGSYTRADGRRMLIICGETPSGYSFSLELTEREFENGTAKAKGRLNVAARPPCYIRVGRWAAFRRAIRFFSAELAKVEP